MNILDIILFLISAVVIVGAIALIVYGIVERDEKLVLEVIFISLLFLTFTLFIPFAAIDFESGATAGEITSVDKSFWGYTKVYIKTTENNEEEYCTDDDGMAELATRVIGKKVKISYGKRVGLYSTSQCHQAPIKSIEFIGE